MKWTPAKITFIALFALGFLGGVENNYRLRGLGYAFTPAGTIDCILLPGFIAGLVSFAVSRYRTGGKPKKLKVPNGASECAAAIYPFHWSMK